jgi:DNA-binding response OmpR family regulator
MTPDSPGRRILVVEDEPMLAFAIEEMLTEAGFGIAGVVGRLETALAIIDSGICDAAILDANLKGVSAGPAASALTARGIPFIVLSGYSREQQPEVFASGVHLQKPCPQQRLIQALNTMLSARPVPTI